MLDSSEVMNPALGITEVVAEVGDLSAARVFYETVLGLEPSGDKVPGLAAPSASFRVGESGQVLSLVETGLRNDPEHSAVHYAYRVSESGRDAICTRIAAEGGEVFDYCEDRPSERLQNYYICDPAGNRIQLVSTPGGPGEGVLSIDHVALEVRDIEWANVFYGEWLGLRVDHRVGWKTQDYLDAKEKGDAGLKKAMPGSRYVNERYSQFESERKSIRPNPQLYYSLGAGMSLAIYLSARHYQLPHDRLKWGTPALGLGARGYALAKFHAILDAKEYPYERQTGESRGQPIEVIRLADPGRNFIELVGPA